MEREPRTTQFVCLDKQPLSPVSTGRRHACVCESRLK